MPALMREKLPEAAMVVAFVLEPPRRVYTSPAIALFKNGQVVHFIERHQIEGRSAQMIAENLIGAFGQHCN